MPAYSKDYLKEREALALIGQRRCVRCGVVYGFKDGFSVDASCVNGRVSVCKRCRAKQARERHHRADSLQGALDNGYKRATRHRRKRRRIKPETLIKHWEAHGVDPMTCFYTGVELTRELHQPNTRNIDHVEPLAKPGSRGHVVNNLVPCSEAFNNYKQQQRAVEAILRAPEDLRAATPTTELQTL